MAKNDVMFTQVGKTVRERALGVESHRFSLESWSFISHSLLLPLEFALYKMCVMVIVPGWGITFFFLIPERCQGLDEFTNGEKKAEKKARKRQTPLTL